MSHRVHIEWDQYIRLVEGYINNVPNVITLQTPKEWDQYIRLVEGYINNVPNVITLQTPKFIMTGVKAERPWEEEGNSYIQDLKKVLTNTIELTQESEVTDDDTTAKGDQAPKQRRVLSGAQRLKLRKMREQGIDTSKVRLPLPQRAHTSKVRLPLPQRAQKSASATSGAVKRTVSARSTPEEKATKRTKSEPGVVSYKAALKGIRAAIIPKDYPASVVTEESVGAIREALMAVIDKADRAPRFETSRLMDDYYGVICAEEDSFNTTRDYLAQETNWKLVRSDELPKLKRVLALVRSDELPKLKRVKRPTGSLSEVTSFQN
ncbi:hypothetical protein QE152_g4222 [Popillia japonica]|uniref:DNA replication factor Cdt1 C-terminal domain-containing protein n=1 Tax=Popillia japonica TaxID=7064 RepID=A0AAW1N1B2_POPJA